MNRQISSLFKQFVVLVFFLGGSTHVLTAQNQSVTVELKNATLKELFSVIEKQTSYRFAYRNVVLDDKKDISISMKNTNVPLVLDRAFTGKNLGYNIVSDKSIVIFDKHSGSAPSNSQSAKRTVTGVIYDETQTPVIGANILVAGSNVGTVSDVDGRFSIEAPSDGTLEISYIGYEKESVKIAGRSSISVAIRPIVLEEVVVVGYGTLKKGSITSAITSVKREDFMQGDVTSVMNLLKGKVAGLNIGNVSGSDPTKDNGGIQMMLRGVSNLSGNQQPLIVVDGIAGASLTAISPDDIESIDVLKDGSAAAIYGTRGNNGVIIVTTKKGTGGKKGKVNVEYHGYATYETIANRIKTFSADEFRELPELAGGKGVNSISDLGASVDWFQEIYQTPVNQNHNLSIRSGDAESNFILTANYIDRDGILKNSSKDQLRMRIAANQSLWDGRLRFSGSVYGTVVSSNYVNPSIYYNSLLANPTAPIIDEKTGRYTHFQDAKNPMQELNEKNTDTKWSRFAVNGKVTVEPIRNLNISAVGSLERFHHQEGVFATFDYFEGETKHGEVWRNSKFNELKTFEGLADYSLTIADEHNLNFLLGYSYQEHNREGFNMYNYDYPTELLSYNQPQLGLALREGNANMGGYKSRSKLISGFARVNYSWGDRYLLAASVRREGSTKFGENHKWGTFPAISAGWNIRNEHFMDNVRWIDELKLRIGYGITGAEPEDPYLSINRYNYSDPVLVDGSWIYSVGPNRNPNRDLRWETKKEFNVGIDFTFLQGRLSGNIDLYNRRTDDLLYTYQVPVPPNLVSDIYANVGSITNSGVEVLLSGILIQKKDLKWSLSGNFSYNKNMLNKLSNEMYQRDFLETGGTGHPIQKTTHIVREGEPIGNFFGWRSASISADGANWLDVDGNIITMENDKREVIGNGIPKIFYGVSTNLNWKGLDAGISLRGAGCFQILNQYRMLHGTFMEGGNQNYSKTILDKPYGTDAYVYAAPSYVSYYVENGDYLKIDNVTIGYSFNFKKYVNKLRIYLSGNNLYTFTKYTGIDPEVNMMGLSPGIDQIGNIYPSTRSFSLGVQLSLF